METPVTTANTFRLPGLFPDDKSIPLRPPLIPDTIFKRCPVKGLESDPSFKKDTKRWIRAFPEIGKYVREFNAKNSDNANMQYRWYPNTVEEKDIQAQLYRIVDDKAKEMLDGIYGMMTYREAQLQFGALMESFVNTVAMHPSFDPLTQTVRVFGVRSIIESKMSTKRRAVRERAKKIGGQGYGQTVKREDTNNTTQIQAVEPTIPITSDLVHTEPLAPSKVPDLPQDTIDHVQTTLKNTTQHSSAKSQQFRPATQDSIEKNAETVQQGKRSSRRSAKGTKRRAVKGSVGSTKRKDSSIKEGSISKIAKGKNHKGKRSGRHKKSSSEGLEQSKIQSMSGVQNSLENVPGPGLQESQTREISSLGKTDSGGFNNSCTDSDEEIRELERLLAEKKRKKRRSGN